MNTTCEADRSMDRVTIAVAVVVDDFVGLGFFVKAVQVRGAGTVRAA